MHSWRGEGRCGSWRVEDASQNQFLFHEDFRFLEMGGFNERFIQLGGGFANFDFFSRVTHSEVPRLFFGTYAENDKLCSRV